MFRTSMVIDGFDPELAASISAERQRQEDHIELIASENYASPRVLEAQGSVLTNKYAEGYPGKRYYGGCEHVDTVEKLARDRAKQLFSAKFANVQPHSGTQATLSALMALTEPGDSVLAMSLNHGGHLSHGHPKNASGIFWHFEHYGVRKDNELVDYDSLAEMAFGLGPKVIIAGGSAYPRTLDFGIFAEIAKEVGAQLLVDMAHISGLVAAGLHPSPLPLSAVVASSTHKTLRGPRGGFIVTNDRDVYKSVNSAVFPGSQGGPLMHVIAAKAIAFGEALDPSFRVYAQRVIANAKALAEGLAARGLRIVSGGTDNHLMLVDVTTKGLTGAEAETALHAVDLTCNKNLIPFDFESPARTSGIRLGTAAVTSRGLEVEHMGYLADWIADVLEAPTSEQVRARVRGQVKELCESQPIYSAGAWDRNRGR